MSSLDQSDQSDPRIIRLSKFFNDVLYGRRALNSSRDGKLFLEALCVQADPAVCAHKLLSSPSGVKSLQASMRFDTSPAFLNDHALPLLLYLQDPSLKAIDSGSVLSKLLLSIVEPPFFWDAYTKAFIGCLLVPAAITSYAWLLLHLVRIPGNVSTPYVQLASSHVLDLILKSQNGETRNLGQKIRHSLPLSDDDLHIDAEVKPGGRHDNDHADYRRVSIMPTADELLSKDLPFYRPANFIDDPNRLSSRRALHVDNQFRLLREDMLGDIREEIQVLMGMKSGRHKGSVVEKLRLYSIEMGTEKRRQAWGVKLQCREPLPHLKKIHHDKRKAYLRDNRDILRQGTMACIFIDNEPAAFPSILRIEDELASESAVVTVQFQDDDTLTYALLKMKSAASIRLAQLDTAIFAYEPFLRRLQSITDLPLAEELLHWEDGKGTGKSFLGALVAKVLHDSTSEVILVVCFTNHALDQFLEDLMKIGIPSANMIRLGGKSTNATKPLMLREQNSVKLNASHWTEIDKLKQSLRAHENRLQDAFGRYQSTNVQKRHLMEYLEFLEEDMPYFETFTVPAENDGMTRVGRNNKAVDPYYLLDRWIRGQPDSGSFRHAQPKGATAVWEMPVDARNECMNRWKNAILSDLVAEVRDAGRAFNADRTELDRVFGERDTTIIKSKRIIACTTNGAAKFTSAIQSASPGIVLVEEAGEILEAHILTSLGANTQQLILIGDHQQLRPKCSYELSVEKNEGFDLNRSLFERLILKGFPHVTLTKQHRMRPEISSMVRLLTYPDLTDADTTLQRPDLRGFRDNIIFIDHNEPEIELINAKELKDGKTSSKQNDFEAQMILKCVRYLAQQGYGTDKMVVITPYLGQLKHLRDLLAKYNDPILNDLDKFDLIRAGLLSDLGSKSTKPALRISTIDNYQGEESDIVLVSMTRSNKSHDIGFMAAPERLNVLLSRARDALIMIGNSDTFINARKGREIWRKLLDHLKENGHVYEGFPVKCEKHPDRAALLCSPSSFDTECPDGGCKEPCGASLKCGLHKCPSSCHQIFDHSKMKCEAVMNKKCANGHPQSWRCFQGPITACSICERERKLAEKKAKKALDDKLSRDEKMQRHQKEIEKLDEEIEKVVQSMKDMRIESEQAKLLAQKRKDLEAAKQRAKTSAAMPEDRRPSELDAEMPVYRRPKTTSCGPRSTPPTNTKASGQPAVASQSAFQSSRNQLRNYIEAAIDHNKSPSKTEWQRQKDQENTVNPAIDDIMEMIGLEEVKSQVLRIKSKVETSIRQNTDLKKERLGLVLLGNPGTGKTTVARHYAKVLTSLQVLGGDEFVETTGSRLAHGGITEVKNHLAQLEKAEGGVYFIDEAYQLAEGHNFGGKTVLDFLLAEIENFVGKVVFVFAGYRKEMEKFFEHNPGLSSRIPYTLQFEDYTDTELLQMLQFQMNKFYHGSMVVEDGPDGLYMRIATRRLGRGRGRDGFGNARALENLFARIRERQSDRLSKERKEGLAPDDNFITKEDLIGPDPSKAILTCDALVRLRQLTGLKSVKDSVDYLIDLIKTNYQREIEEVKLVDAALNRCFLGSPGTGKTTVAKLYGRILADIGLLSNGEVVTKNPSDFIGSAIGESEKNTKAILASTVGKVLIIDEAYMLYTSSGAGGGGAGAADIYRTAVIDTIVAECQSVPGEDRCVLLLGYEPQMVEMFQNVNPGLTRRFPIADSFRFEDFTDTELEEILRFKLKDRDLGATEEAVSVAVGVLARARNGLHFGNGGDVENLISKAKSNYQARQSKLPSADRSTRFHFEPQDFDPDYNRAAGAENNLQELFKDVIGCDEIIAKLDGFLQVAKGMRAQNLDPRGQIPMNFLFKGPPGTGKTTTARKIGQVYYDLGFLTQVEVVECSASNLIGQYVGQTGPKVIAQMERGLGKVLFVDEAYRLGEGLFAQEAVNELVDNMTKPKFKGKLVIILAGYNDDMDKLLRVNEGLSSRFADEIIFRPLNAENSLHILEAQLQQSKIQLLSFQEPAAYKELLGPMAELSQLPAWGNARDVQTLAKSIVRAAFLLKDPAKFGDQLILPHEVAMHCLSTMLSDRRARDKNTIVAQPSSQILVQQLDNDPRAHPPQYGTANKTAAKEDAQPTEQHTSHDQVAAGADHRDPGVSDATWAQLEIDKQISILTAQNCERIARSQEEAIRLAAEAENRAGEDVVLFDEVQARHKSEVDELMRRREEARINGVEAKAEAAQAEIEAAQARVDEALRKREEARTRQAEAMARRERIEKEQEGRRRMEQTRKQTEQRAQAKLNQMGICPAGYRWYKSSGGYRCGGGSHFVGDAQLRD
ncbi:NFX1-type zinc finger-containing protein 1 [Drepanopeziza brunnea f. sp. 'multigermtubi' MB_m1]|uniref:NFX1-type zinc finger-containing protein 1 n=1 Tax=Marssonina brunnea f. sp. multigermtubi (strain MB_m1) TaxID=1072389 RepID=K1XXP5_MARBU|nr:NFX1-type zinc finger-containing protein 1 [Drepanopeziza brunnea f. sp. 'multigermtubi' MB_m1]EKD17579.1 NFX1-type zinc finger-containing protein 1 [Drepanopeziza brunnea f. sp. 'multigermtubi' MB_m1]